MHLLTFGCYHRLPHFASPEAGNLFESALEGIQNKSKVVSAPPGVPFSIPRCLKRRLLNADMKGYRADLGVEFQVRTNSRVMT
jgi:hypothetical protein